MKELRINVRYKGDTFILQPGHKVYECDTDTGIVKEHQLKKSFWSRVLFWTEPIFEVDYKQNLIHRPFFDIDKAVTGFNQMCRQLIIERKKEGKRLVIKKAVPNE